MLGFLLRMALKNSLRHKLRALLTLAGIVVAILAFGLLRTVVSAWYAGADAASASRLVTRNSISLVFSLPVSYEQKIRQVDGVSLVAKANWFGGVYIDERNFFPQFAVDDNYLSLYPEYVLSEDERKAFLIDRRGAIAGRKLANRYGWKIGDIIPIRGTIFPGEWSFVLRGIYDGARKNTDTNQLFFRYDYLNESLKKTAPRRADRIGVYIVGINAPERAAAISEAIDATFKNSLAETLTETEKAFQLSFVAMTGTIVLVIELVSYVVILIIMAVMANTMAMSARERISEYATLKALGFGPGVVAMLVFSESLALALLGGGVGIVLTFPLARGFGNALDNLFPVFLVADETVVLQAVAAFVIGVVAALAPAVQATRVRIVDGLRSVA